MNSENTGKATRETAVDFNLNFTYSSGKKRALDHVAGEIPKGTCICLCGGSGSGKSTLLYCMNKLVPEFYEGNLSGFCHINSKNMEDLSVGETGKLAASVFQDPRSQFFTLNSTSEVAFGLENFGFSHDEIVSRTEKAFTEAGLTYLKDRQVFELSSGERQLVAILAANAMDCGIYLLDEPTANLDYAAIENLKHLLMSLKRQGKTLIISEHRLYYLSEIADEYWLVEDGKIEKKFTGAELAGLTRAELAAYKLRTNDLSKVEFVEWDKNVGREAPTGIELKNVRFRYKKSAENVIQNLNFRVGNGEIVGLLGANGCGKTTLGKIMTGLYRINAGEILLNGQKVRKNELIKRSIFIMQEAEFQFFTNSVMNELYYGMKTKEEKRGKKAEIEYLLKKTGLWPCRNQHPFSLSGGQMQKLVLLLAYLSKKEIVVLDEPSAGLDYESMMSCSELIRNMSENKTVFVITHDTELIANVCQRAVFIENGGIGKDYMLRSQEDFSTLKKDMEAILTKQNQKASACACTEQPEKLTKPPRADRAVKTGHLLDPRVKMLIFLFALISGIGTHIPLILCTYLSIVLVFSAEGQIRRTIAAIVTMAGIFVPYFCIRNVVTAFLISFFPRMLVICFATLMLAGKREAERTTAALRKLHVNEKIIMMLSVTFRFFPVLKKDLAIMGQSLKTRGFFPKFRDKIKAVPAYLEIMVVPMVFRVIRIAEALSASAETRGIDLAGRRQSYIELKITAKDIVFLCLATALFVTGIILPYIL